MRFAIAAIVAFGGLLSSDHALASTFRISVPSGVRHSVHTYANWNGKDCSSRTGIVRVVTKPQNGTLIPSLVDTTIGTSRFNRLDASCAGRPIKAFRVEYQSRPGYHGGDTFTIEVTYTKRSEIDVYLVMVQ